VGADAEVHHHVTVAYPAAPVLNGDALVMFVSSNVTGIGAPANDWLPLGAETGGGGMFCRKFIRIAAGGETGNVTVSAGATGAKGEAHIARYRSTNKTPIKWVAETNGTDTNTASTAISIAGSSITTQINDVIVKSMAVLAPSGSYTAAASGPAMTQSGATITFTARFSGRTGTNTIAYAHGDATVTAGGAGAPTFTATAVGANAGGVAGFVVLREVPAQLLNAPSVATQRAANW
jgi:hypothetical protein